MISSKITFLSLGFFLTVLISGKSFADANSDCRAAAAGSPTYQTDYDQCMNEHVRVAQEQAAAEALNPGTTPPEYICGQYSGTSQQSLLETCQKQFDLDMADYNVKLNAYYKYLTDHPDIKTIKTRSVTDTIKEVGDNQRKAADRLKSIAKTLRTIGTAMMGLGLALIAGGYSAVWGAVVLAVGVGLMLWAQHTENKEARYRADIVMTCQQLNKVSVKQYPCPDMPPPTTTSDSTFTIGGTTPVIPEFIDQTTGGCKVNAPPECSVLVKNAPAGCFKKGSSCMASIPKTQIIQHANGKITVPLNGKTRTFGMDDFSSEASMVSAGFTPAQAKAFMSSYNQNDPNSLINKAKAELKNGSGVSSGSMQIIPTSSSGFGRGNSEPTASSKIKKDEYVPTPVTEVARIPASAEGSTKDYHGDTIGAEGDNVFQMINRRYNLKQHQNIFLEQ